MSPVRFLVVPLKYPDCQIDSQDILLFGTNYGTNDFFCVNYSTKHGLCGNHKKTVQTIYNTTSSVTVGLNELPRKSGVFEAGNCATELPVINFQMKPDQFPLLKFNLFYESCKCSQFSSAKEVRKSDISLI